MSTFLAPTQRLLSTVSPEDTVAESPDLNSVQAWALAPKTSNKKAAPIIVNVNQAPFFIDPPTYFQLYAGIAREKYF
jgi:hypothetical protein